MEKQLFLLILVMGAIWLVLDDLYGQKKLEKFIFKVVG